jgi:hypothetical protein
VRTHKSSGGGGGVGGVKPEDLSAGAVTVLLSCSYNFFARLIKGPRFALEFLIRPTFVCAKVIEDSFSIPVLYAVCFIPVLKKVVSINSCGLVC